LQLGRGNQVVRGRRNQIVREVWLELNPSDAAAWEVEEGDEVEVLTLERRLAGRARLTELVPPGVIATTSLFGQLAVDLQASEEMDPASRPPVLDIRPARIEKINA
jgi:anaerobic selenocysteine-containing dehydrogenase